jgi:hypothetical protein
MSLFKRSTTRAVLGLFFVAPVVYILLDQFVGRIPAWIGMAIIVLASGFSVQVEPVTPTGAAAPLDIRPAIITSMATEKERAQREKRDPAA